MDGIAYFVTPHGYGHAARACAVMEALAERRPALRFEIFSSLPEWFFRASLRTPFQWHDVVTDVGMVQRSSLEEDPAATAVRLAQLLPPPAELVQSLVRTLHRCECRAVLADISPLGLLTAEAAGLPSVLIENFTWDWIYNAYADHTPELAPFGSLIATACAGATLRLQTEPVCRRVANARLVAPVSRRRRHDSATVRAALGVPERAPLVLLTMGGIPYDFGALGALTRHREAWFVVPGAAPREIRDGHLIALPHHSAHYHPDLVGAADLVVGKVGYSTLAEVFATASSLAYVARPRFPESAILARWAEEQLGAREVAAAELADGSWLARLDELVSSRSPATRRSDDGAQQAASAILELLA